MKRSAWKKEYEKYIATIFNTEHLKTRSHSIHRQFLTALAAFAMVSCTTHRQLVYLESGVPAQNDFYASEKPEYLLQTRDILYIRVYSLNEEMSNLINQTTGNNQQNLFQNETSLFINGYTVTDSGYVEIPVLGRINVVNMTVNDATQAVRERADRYLKDATVIVKLLSFRYSVIGEVNRPGSFNNFNSQLTVLEAISNAGDITDYGNRRKVLVLRPSDSGTTTFRLDLTSREILTSEGFYILPNDVVYVEPVKSKTFRINTPSFSLILTSVSTLILVLNFLNK
jgi:polysaccharide biosynthesis/export protein